MTLGQILYRHPSLRRNLWVSATTRCTHKYPTLTLQSFFSTKTQKTTDEIDAKAMAQRYEKQRQLYKKQVSSLRKQYAQEISTQKALEKAKQAKEREEIVRRKQERQRAKNLRSIENAKRDLAEKAQSAQEFEEKLKVMQVKRDARNELFRKARMLFLEELEAESVHWMTTPEEVDDKLGGWETEQLLWSTPYLIGVAPDDAIFWRYQSHSQSREKTLLSPREHILEQLEEHFMMEANLNPGFWTPERRQKAIQWQEKAKLRALVQNYGRSLLLKKQHRMLQDEYLQNAPDKAFSIKGNKYDRSIIRPQKKIPAPSLEILANEQVQEEEGAKLLMEDPSKFFLFEGDMIDSSTLNKLNATDTDNDNDNNAVSEHDDNGQESSSTTSVRGKPISLKHEFGPKGNAEPYPLLLAKNLNDDKLTEKEKKRAQKEDERLAKLRQSMEVEQGGVDFEHDSGPPAEIQWDVQDLAWEEEMMRKYGGNGGISLEDLKSIPMEQRLSEEDIEWITSRLQSKLKAMDASRSEQSLDGGNDELTQEVHRISKQVGVIMRKLNDSQRDAMSDLDLSNMLHDDDIDDQELMKEIQSCIGSDTLSKDDLKTIIEIERKLYQDEALKEKLTN